MDISGARALVTGGASGIGAAAAAALEAEGASVVRTDLASAEGIVFQDVTDAEAWPRLVAEHGPFDIVFLNAGITTKSEVLAVEPGRQPLLETSVERYRQVMGVNVDGVVYGAMAVLPGMLERGKGMILATASMAGILGMGSDPIYGVTKHAVVGLTRSLGQTLQGTGVAISCLCPGFVDTPMVPDDIRGTISAIGLELISRERIGALAVRAIREAVNGAQWVIWSDQEPEIFPLPVPPSIVLPG